MNIRRVAMIGFGEAGSILGEDLVKAGCDVVTYDILFDAEPTRAALRAKAAAVRVKAAGSVAEAAAGVDLLVSAVTASSSPDVATLAGKSLREGQTFLDINSCAPATKRGNRDAVEANGAHYVEAAVMAPVPPQRLEVPMLLGGRTAAALAPVLNDLGMRTTAIAEEIGIASAVKMCRSIIIKGLEALALESVMAARRFGAEAQVFASLEGTFPGMGWEKGLPDYLVSRIAEHGQRRAAEMREVAKTLEDVGLEPTMARATALREDALIDQMNALGLAYPHDEAFSWRKLIDALAAGEKIETKQRSERN